MDTPQADTSSLGDESGGSAADHRRLTIVGSGIAALTAAIYAGRSNNDPLLIEGDEPGGQLTLTTDVDNYPGFPDGINGSELINRMRSQAQKFGAEIEHGIVESVDDSVYPFEITLSNGTVYTANAVIAASGASARTLGIPGEDELMGYGVSTCATCDGPFFRDENMIVVGGGDAAMEEADFLTKFADTVYLVHRREEFRAEDFWVDRTMENVESGDIEIVRNTEMTKIHGTPEDGIDHVHLVSHPDGHPKAKLDGGDKSVEEDTMDVGAVFLAIGHTPNTAYFEETGVELDEDGYLITHGGRGGEQTKTDVEGIFGAGDVVDYHYQQAVTAAGMGSQAAIDADEWLASGGPDAIDSPEPAPADD
ncbi:NAD(P)/FAD-dependent oxidoreductase [Halodesulfurarchaeum sp.]|uniref:NAD(P)/FAD-dependent oxidoreductase n=1 Tax=Halodesulfurarchaeum sp. TaxID=1980530 RepID=UPI002FC28FEE